MHKLERLVSFASFSLFVCLNLWRISSFSSLCKLVLFGKVLCLSPQADSVLAIKHGSKTGLLLGSSAVWSFSWVGRWVNLKYVSTGRNLKLRTAIVHLLIAMSEMGLSMYDAQSATSSSFGASLKPNSTEC